MPRQKKDGRFINYYIDRTIYERLEQYAEDKAQPVTAALERILDEYLTRYEAEMATQVRYCPNCHTLVHTMRCPLCDRRWLEPPAPEDFCFLTEKDGLWAGVLEDCLRQNAIPYLTQGTLGAGMTANLGMLHEKTKFFVRYAYYDRANDLENELFNAETYDLEEKTT